MVTNQLITGVFDRSIHPYTLHARCNYTKTNNNTCTHLCLKKKEGILVVVLNQGEREGDKPEMGTGQWAHGEHMQSPISLSLSTRPRCQCIIHTLVLVSKYSSCSVPSSEVPHNNMARTRTLAKQMDGYIFIKNIALIEKSLD